MAELVSFEQSELKPYVFLATLNRQSRQKAIQLIQLISET